ncbi:MULTISPECIES: tRNA (adenosine(37)-N6)-threonylcarbamoyltransferase complex transferase subunit TsaD [Facklamia]|uniref:tRNA N6-adenosine threonylcarbamoyltransferase n=2 Tax=Facklamia hominis TaxID=178214 RepID=K1LRT8_9LACT|nr:MULTISPECIES: tRNA (adenosine(37)-N6)-threonylcarbamoyltransferase complex transferase subunit TsaD [Facklamia]EKB54827.1 glycoprotease/Kae1 family metallohydrolase [Facklamia hominis CCUG 36813]EPH07684.1 glycoprotease/Kae1 family metallohydrolase [Facklamia hominis ACS-120-V-Sch10]MDK7187655.1 tRNA (adenosine(37)-N6)-threonylcarbamoyltransferase complex transferase subunit TsaD [Facklamia hominis]OFL67662.1 N(6)-L-threonylcarbamoyladenine synthase TsaD [Facklamia sp. HMSC062C11]
MKEDQLILAIESSCDETSVAIVKNGEELLANIVASQVKSHMRFGGVVPEVASRHHVEQITQILTMALEKAGLDSVEKVDAIAVTQGPGLVGPLLVGITAAKTLAFLYDKPLIGVNHLAGHIFASRLVYPLEYPLLSLIVSGGHTELVWMEHDNDFRVLGETLDDAVGEAYDKVGRLIDLPYPAGKHLDQLAHEGDAKFYDIPRALLEEDSLDFSFSGMKSAVMNTVHNLHQRGQSVNSVDLAASFQAAVIEVLLTKVDRAMSMNPAAKQFVLAGGVAANSGLRSALECLFREKYPQTKLLIPPLSLCGDNAAMIAAAAYPLYLAGDFSRLDLNARPDMDFRDEID